jgi:hypothetical protein
MARELFVPRAFQKATIVKIEQANAIIAASGGAPHCGVYEQMFGEE